MKQYLQLNQAKLKFMFKATSIIFGTCVLVFFIIAYFKEKYIPELSLFLSVIAGFSIGMSLLIGIIATLSGYYYYNLKRKKFQTFPFSELDKLGFKLIKCQEETNWALTEEVLSGRINGFQVVLILTLKTNLIF